MGAIRLLAGLVGVGLLILALSIIVNPINALSTRIGIGVFFFACGVIFLSFSARLKKAWTPLWVLGWLLALGAAFQVPYSLYQLGHHRDLIGRLASAFCALISPLQLRLGASAIKTAKRASAPSAEDLLTRDPRAPILYLRRFALDSKASLVRTGKEFASVVFNARTDEELIAEALNEIGPCITIGRPGEKLPHLGFAREYVSDKWQDKVLESMSKAQLVLLMFASASSDPKSASFSWEVQKAVEVVKPQRLIFLVPSDADDMDEFRRITQMLLPQPPPVIPKEAIFRARIFRAVLYFAPDWTPHYAVPTALTHFRRPLTPNKLLPTLKVALRPVYEQLALEWQPPPIAFARILYEGASVVVVLFVLGIVVFGS